MSKRVRISNDSLNSYGTRVLTSGMNVEQYCRNPVLLYQHERGQVIGYVKDLKVENDEVTGELMFDCASELSRQCKKQYEFGSLRMVSVGIDIVELSDDKKYLVEGQTCPTITKSKLFEVSLVDVGANDDAIVLQKDGIRITLGKDGDSPLPRLSNNNNQKSEEMDIKTFALHLGLSETATESEMLAKIEELKAAKEQNKDLQEEKKVLLLKSITNLVEQAILEKKFGEDKKQHFVNLGEQVGVDALKETLDAMSPKVKLSQMVEHETEEETTTSPWEERMKEIREKLKK